MRHIITTTIVLGLGMMSVVPVQAAPISTNTALPVAKGEYVFREQDLNGTALERDYIIRGGYRVNF